MNNNASSLFELQMFKPVHKVNVLFQTKHTRIVDHILYENIGQILPKKLHGPMHYTICDACVYNGHVFYS